MKSNFTAQLVSERLMDLAASGMTRQQAVEATGLSYASIHQYCKNYKIEFRREWRRPEEDVKRQTERADEMARRYVAGETLQSIADDHALTRERVRQILTKTRGFDRTDGGQFLEVATKRVARETQRERDCRARWGCSIAEHNALLEMGRKNMAAGRGRAQTPTGAFATQKSNAARRSIGWHLSLWQWWTIWQESGRWEDRGRGHGYMMCRKGDAGPYSVENVVIAPGHFNASFQIRKKSGLPTGVMEKKGRFIAHITADGRLKYLGVFPTPELAHNAYLTALSEIAAPVFLRGARAS